MTAMGWFLTASVGEFLAEAGDAARASPARASIAHQVEDHVVFSFAGASRVTLHP